MTESNESELSDEEFWRGVFVIPSNPEVIFSKEVEIKVNELPTWKPHIMIDTYRIEEGEDD